MMKKFMTLLLALLMVLALVGCSSKGGETETDSGTEELVFWAHTENAWLESYQAVIDAFEAENPGIKIRLEDFPYDEFETKTLTSLASKEGGADIYELWGGWGVDYSSTGAFAAMPDALATEIINDSYPSTIGALQYNGKLYGMPFEFNIEYGAMLVNNELLAEAGLKPATTWSEWMEQGRKLTKEENGVLTRKGIDFMNADGLAYTYTAMMLQSGVNYLNEDGTFNFNNEVGIKAFKEIADLLVGPNRVTELGELADPGVIGYEELYKGITAYVPRGPWAINAGSDTFGLTLGNEFDYVAMPWYGDTKAFAAETGWSLAVNAKSAHQDAAFKFVEFFFQDERIIGHNIAAGQIPAKKSVAQSAEYAAACPYAKPLTDILEYGQFIGLFNTDRFKEALYTTLIDYVQGGVYATVEEAVADIETKCNAING